MSSFWHIKTCFSRNSLKATQAEGSVYRLWKHEILFLPQLGGQSRTQMGKHLSSWRTLIESYLVWQRQGEEVKSVGVPLSDDLRQGLVVPHLSRQLGLVMKAHRDRGAQGYRPVGRVTSGALRRVEVGLVNEARGHGRPGLGRRGSIIHRRRVRGPVVVDGRAQNRHFVTLARNLFTSNRTSSFQSLTIWTHLRLKGSGIEKQIKFFSWEINFMAYSAFSLFFSFKHTAAEEAEKTYNWRSKC